MANIRLTVTVDENGVAVGDGKTILSENDKYGVHFEFAPGSGWDACPAKILKMSYGETTRQIPFVGCDVEIPPVFGAGSCRIGVYTYMPIGPDGDPENVFGGELGELRDDDLVRLSTTTDAVFRCIRSTLSGCAEDDPIELPEEVYARLVGLANAGEFTGEGIAELVQTVESDSPEGVNVWTLTTTLGRSFDFRVRNGISFEEAEAARVENETARVASETGRSSAEGLRAAAEAIRVGNETARLSSESVRESNELTRIENENARLLAEQTRSSAETSRETSENSRRESETLRASAEAQRISAEGLRTAAEEARIASESSRGSAEETRVSSESARVSAETARESSEIERNSSEAARIAAESDRAAAEALRASAESARETAFSTAISAAASATAAANAAASGGSVLTDLDTGTCYAYRLIIDGGHPGIEFTEISGN